MPGFPRAFLPWTVSQLPPPQLVSSAQLQAHSKSDRRFQLRHFTGSAPTSLTTSQEVFLSVGG